MENKMRVIETKAFDKIKWACQRLTRGWDDRAVWNIDYYLACLLPGLLTELKEKGNGFPCALIPDDIGENITEEVEKKCREKWNEILDAIIEGFEEYKKLSSCLLHPDFKMEKFEKGFALFKKHFSSLWY